MKVFVEKEGLLIPKEFLKGIKKADVKWEKGKIVIEPSKEAQDPIFDLGRRPGHSGIKDTSACHDKYLYYEET